MCSVKVAVMGASVSAQGVHHKTGNVTGYREVLQREYRDELGVSEFLNFTYPGNRASDAGLVRVKDLVAASPQICLFEPSVEDGSRGSATKTHEVRYIYSTLLDAGILPVTLMLPLPNKKTAKVWPHYSLYMSICAEYKLPVIEIDLSDLQNEEVDRNFAGVHTLPGGAKIYAKRIASGLRRFTNPDGLRAALSGVRVPAEPGLHVQKVPCGAAKTFDSLSLNIHPEKAEDTNLRIIQMQSIGPFSPVISIRAETRVAGQSSPVHDQQERSIWDPYCHYVRQSFVTLGDMSFPQAEGIDLSISLSSRLPDYASCRREGVTWPDPVDMALHALGPLYLISDHPVQAHVTHCGQS